MNSIRVSEISNHAWLEVKINESDDYGFSVSSSTFDGTPFTIRATKLQVEVDPQDDKKGLLKVGKVGTGFGYVEIILPSPALQFGHQLRVLANQLVETAPTTVNVGKKYKKNAD